MQLQIEIGGKARTVTVQREGEKDSARFTVTVDGRPHVVDARRVAADTVSLLLIPDGGSEPVRRVESTIVAGREPGALTIGVNGQDVPVQVRNGGAGRRGRDTGSASGSGPQRVVAPMPGKVVRVLVKPGDEVKPRQGLIVIEAMKMENELKAARAGRVRDVHVAEAQSVDAGTVLVIVE
jgi:biotin carboxyl carrier protein